MKNTALRLSTVLVVILGLGSFIGCRSSHILGNSEIPTAKKLSDVMWSQAQLADPAFKKITTPAYNDADWAAFTALGERLQLTSLKLKQDFSKGDNWDALAAALDVHGRDLIDAAKEKDHTAASAALTATRADCRACHKEYR